MAGVPFLQQRYAGQMPRGTRLVKTTNGRTRIEIKGSRNYTALPLYIDADELYEDIVDRGLRACGLSKKLGVLNKKETISKFINGVFQDDGRLDEVLRHYNCQRQKSNPSKCIFPTITNSELKMISRQMLPEMTAEVGCIFSTELYDDTDRLLSTLQVLENMEKISQDNTLTSDHSFQTHGFLYDVIKNLSKFLTTIIERIKMRRDSGCGPKDCKKDRYIVPIRMKPEPEVTAPPAVIPEPTTIVNVQSCQILQKQADFVDVNNSSVKTSPPSIECIIEGDSCFRLELGSNDRGLTSADLVNANGDDQQYIRVTKCEKPVDLLGAGDTITLNTDKLEDTAPSNATDNTDQSSSTDDIVGLMPDLIPVQHHHTSKNDDDDDDNDSSYQFLLDHGFIITQDDKEPSLSDVSTNNNKCDLTEIPNAIMQYTTHHHELPTSSCCDTAVLSARYESTNAYLQYPSSCNVIDLSSFNSLPQSCDDIPQKKVKYK